MDITLEGKIIAIGALEHVGQNNLPKRTFVLEEVTDKEWKWWVAIDLLKERTSLVDECQVWDHVKVAVNFRANQYNNKRYNSISAWRIDKLNGASASNDTAPQPSYNEVDDELPF